MTMALIDVPSEITPRHVRAARALLAWSQQDLAKAAGVARPTVADYERGKSTAVPDNVNLIRSALERAGIRFLPTGPVGGLATARIKQPDRPGMPVRWVDATDLHHWADRRDGSSSLPTLLAFLIRANHGTSVSLRFPADEGVQHSGFDGWTESPIAGEYVPQGNAVWEVSAQRKGISSKADKDFHKRSNYPAPIDPSAATFVFATLRRWPQKAEWVSARKNDGKWRDVRAYDADDLVHWIEQTPAVGLWLATRLGKRPPGTRELNEVWDEWSCATKFPLTERLVLSDRDQDVADLQRWLWGEPSLLSLQASSTEEVVAFLHAALSELPDDVGRAFRARCLVVTTAEAARAVAASSGPLILVLTDPDPGLAHALMRKGHFVLQAYDERPTGNGPVRTLSRPTRESIASALVESGVAEPIARKLARDSARNFAVLRRLVPAAPGQTPGWSDPSAPRALLAALLAGGWDESNEADKERVSELADAPYNAVVAALMPYLGQFDRPLQKIGSTWRIASPHDAWLLLAYRLTAADLERFEIVADKVLGSVDPRFDMDGSQRWAAAIHGVHCQYSRILRHGIGQVLILLALWGDRAAAVPDAPRRADAIVARLLRSADARRWWSLSRDFRLLAEASPSAFLAAVDESLDQADPPIGALFGHDEGGVFGNEYLSDLMWALESLAWSPDWMARVSHVLARLDAIDTKPRKFSNGPGSSLRSIHLLWSPQTYSGLDERLRALDLIRKREPETAWKIMLGILPRAHDSLVPSCLPRWRDFNVDQIEPVTSELVSRGAAAISGRLLADVGAIASRWAQLLDRLGDLAPGPEAVLPVLETAEREIADVGDRTAVREQLRQVLHHNRRFPDAQWRLPDPMLDRLEDLYERFAPVDPLENVAWLFQQHVKLPTPTAAGWQAEEQEVEAARVRAAMSIYTSRGVEGVLALARLTKTPGWLGKAMHDGGLPPAEVDALIERAVRSDDANERGVAHGLIVSVVQDRGIDWAAALFAKARSENWGDIALAAILHALPAKRQTWELASALGGDVEASFWKRAFLPWSSEDGEDVSYSIHKLIEVGRARDALSLADRGGSLSLPSELLLRLLQEAERHAVDAISDHNDAVMFQHEVAEVLAVLDTRDDVDPNALAMLEWKYLQVLRYSQRRPKVLLRLLAEQPTMFIQMLSAVYRPSEESGIVDPRPDDPERAKAIATQAYRLLDCWDRIPGTRDDGTVDWPVLQGWIEEARRLAASVGRDEIADSRIGNIMSASSAGADGAWPAEAVRNALDHYQSSALVSGFIVGTRNRRGTTTRNPRDGGVLERAEAARYRAWAQHVSLDHPRTAEALRQIAESYEHDARWHDEDAARLDWED